MAGSGHTSSIKNVRSTYEEFNEKAADDKSVWHHFLRATDKQSAQCKKCKKILKSTGGSTTGLRTHLRSAHVILFEDKQDAPNNQGKDGSAQLSLPPTKKAKLTDYFLSKNSVEARVSRMASLDGMPLSKFCTSDDLRDLFNNANLKLPRSPNTIKKIILDYAVKIQQEVRVELDGLKTQGCKFALTFDEWTSNRNRRYINVNIHSQMLSKTNFRNLGLIRIKGAMPAEKCIALLEKRLSIYKISLYRDIAGITTDGASIMAKVGRILKVFHQLCFAHGIQLAVLDVLYKNNSTTLIPVTEEVPQQDEHSDDDENVSEENDEGSFEIIHTTEENTLKDQNFQDIIKKVRKVTKIFRKSSTKNDDMLQKYVQEEFGKELNLIQDCPTRWSSLADMIKRFLQLKKCVSKALIDLKSPLSFSEQEIQTLTSIEKCLDVVKATVEALCRRDANLITAETAMMFMMRKLKEQNTGMSNDMAKALGFRIKQRRTLASSILIYLNKPKEYFKLDADSIFINHSTEEITHGLVSFQQSRLCEKQDDIVNARDSDSISISDNSPENSSLSIAEELEKELMKCQAPKQNTKEQGEDDSDVQNIISVEMVLYENGGSRGKYLEEAYKYMSSIPPTSVEAERAFSSAGYICNKIRSSLSDETLDALSFLRAHFQQQKK